MKIVGRSGKGWKDCVKVEKGIEGLLGGWQRGGWSVGKSGK